MKRLFDVLVAFCGVLFFLPFGLIIALCISLESRGSVFYLQRRIGQHAKPFQLIKFRTMRKNAERQGKLTIGMRDDRITRVGYFLRKYKLDEFPQFLNVLKGEMSVVGPRPEVEEYVRMYTESQREILNVRPGITDYASLEYFEENRLLGASENPKKTYIEEIMPAKIELNRKYLSNPTLVQDIKIICKTVGKILGVFSEVSTKRV